MNLVCITIIQHEAQLLSFKIFLSIAHVERFVKRHWWMKIQVLSRINPSVGCINQCMVEKKIL